MDPLTMAAIAAGGSIIQGLGSYKSAQKQMKFQSQMSNTAYQRQMADLRAAGINPMLAAKLGGASTPAGASYSIPNIGMAAVEGYKSGVSANQMSVATAIEKRTLDYLEKENLTMPQIMYTAKNVFSSKMLDTFEKGLSGRWHELPNPYRGIGQFLHKEFRDAGMISQRGEVMSISGEGLGNLIAKAVKLAADSGVQAVTETGKGILEAIADRIMVK